MDLDHHLATKIFEAFTKPLGVWYHHVDVTVFVVTVDVVGGGGVVAAVLGLSDAQSMVAADLEPL